MNNKKDKKGFRLGRNLLTLILIASGVIVIFLIALLISEIRTINSLKVNVTPYKTSLTTNVEGTIDLDEVKRVEASKFNLYDITINLTTYTDNQEKTYVKSSKNSKCDNPDSMSVKVILKSNDNTPKLKHDGTSGEYYGECNIALGTDVIGDEAYSTVRNLTSSHVSSSTSFTLSLTSNVSYPCKIKKGLYSKKVSEPDFYLFLSLNTDENGKLVKKQYIIHYTYQDLYTSTTNGAIIEP